MFITQKNWRADLERNYNNIEEIRKSGTEVYSISRLDCINRCLYEAYRTYILGQRGKGNIYSNLGGRIHEVLEGITNGTTTEADLLPAMQAELEDLDMLGIEFPKGKNGEDTIRQSWIEDMTHFCKTYKAPKGKELVAEEQFIYHTPKGVVLQGYIDLQYIRPDGSIDIYDYKTSTMYKGADIDEHARQLIVYALGKEQEGKKVHSASWIFLKYVTVKYFGKKTARSKEMSWITKDIERRKIGKELAQAVTDLMLEKGYDDVEIDLTTEKFRHTNDFDVLPEDIRGYFIMHPCIVNADLTEEAKQECINYIESTVENWESLSGEEKDYPPRKFTRIQKSGKEVGDYFFCTSLCGHFDNCPHIKYFLEDLQDKQRSDPDEDLF